MDRERIERCLERVRAYRTSGQKAKVWAQANDMDLGVLGSWCAHSARWQRMLDGVAKPVIASAPGTGGFVAARVVVPMMAASVRVELNAGGARLDLHWPLTHPSELATLLREFSR